MLVGWSVKAVVERARPRGGACGACCWLALVDARARRAPLLLAHARLQRRARDRVRAPQRPLRAPAAPAAVVLLPLAHRRPHEPLRQRPRRRAPAARPGAAQRWCRRRCSIVAVIGAMFALEREARAAGAAPVSRSSSSSRAGFGRSMHRCEPRRAGRARRALEPAAGDDLGHRGGEGLRDGERRRRRASRRRTRSSTGASSRSCA